jgi:hypothetical protein
LIREDPLVCKILDERLTVAEMKSITLSLTDNKIDEPRKMIMSPKE